MSTSTELVLATRIQPPHPQPDGRSIVGRMVDRVRAWLVAGGSAALVTGGGGGPVGLNYGNWIMNDPYGVNKLPAVTEGSAMGLPAFGRGVELIASRIANVELWAYRYDPNERIDVRLDPQPPILANPDPFSTPWHWRFAMVEDLILYGNSFALLGEPNSEGWPTYLLPIDATRVAFGTNRETGEVGWRVGADFVPWGSLFHVSAGNRSGKILGRGVIAQYFDALQGALAVERSARRYHGAGGMPGAILQSTNPDLSQETADQMKTRYRETVGSGSREPIVLPASWSFTPVVTDADKQQMVESRKWDASTAAMILGIPPAKLGLEGPSMTYSNTELDDVRMVTDTLERWAQPIAESVTKWLLPHGQTARPNWAGRMRTDRKTRAETLKTEIEAKILTEDEARREVGRPAIVPHNEPADPTVEVTQ